MEWWWHNVYCVCIHAYINFIEIRWNAVASDASKNKQYLMLHTECDVCMYSVVYVFKKRFTIWKQILTKFNPYPSLQPFVVDPLIYCFILRFYKPFDKKTTGAAFLGFWYLLLRLKIHYISANEHTPTHTHSCLTVNKVILSVL